MQTLMIDCSQLCYKAFYTSLKGLSYDEKETGIIFGFLMQVFKLSKDFNTDKFLFCWDSKRNLRKMMYPEYKEKRKKELTEEEIEDNDLLYKQMDMLRKDILPRMGFVNSFIRSGYEADDLIAYLAKRGKGHLIVSNDKDLYQLLDDCPIYLGVKERFTKNDFVDFYGIEPSQWVEAKAIGGCNSDCVKGVKGAADPAKSTSSKAIAYIKGELTKGVVFDRIKESKDIIERNKKLVTIPFDDGFDLEIKEDEFKFLDWLDVFDEFDLRSFSTMKYLANLKKYFRFDGNDILY